MFGKDRNAKHRCEKDGKKFGIVKSSFLSYQRLLYPHDALGRMDDNIKQQVVAQFHLQSSPAVEWLLDEHRQPVANFPFPVNAERLRLVTGLVYWKEPKTSLKNFYMAVDVALRELAPADTSLQMASQGVPPTAAAVALYNTNQDKFWHQDFNDRIIDNILENRGRIQGCICLRCGDVKLEAKGREDKLMMFHAPCTRKKMTGASTHDFYWFEPKTLIDLPHDISRILFYRATRGDVDPAQHQAAKDGRGVKRAQKAKGKVEKEEKEEKTIEDWKGVLHWGR